MYPKEPYLPHRFMPLTVEKHVRACQVRRSKTGGMYRRSPLGSPQASTAPDHRSKTGGILSLKFGQLTNSEEHPPRHVPTKIIGVPDIPYTFNMHFQLSSVTNLIHGRQVLNIDALINPQSLDYFKDKGPQRASNRLERHGGKK